MVLINGFPQTRYMRRKVMPDLARRHTVFVPEMRGCGDSDKPEGGYDADTMAGDVHALVEHLGFGPDGTF